VAEVLATAGEIALAGGFPVPLVVRVPYGPEAHGLDAAAGRFVGRLPGVSVVAGSSGARSAGLVAAALTAARPVVVLEARRTDRGSPAEIALDRAIVERAGDQVVLAAWAGGVAAALAAAERLAASGVSAAVLDLVALTPIDAATLGDAVRRAGRLVVVDPAGDPLAADALSAALDAAFLYLEAPFARTAANVDAILDAARRTLEF
jgi:pyruvate dehydrogenase E1 component beta subunit